MNKETEQIIDLLLERMQHGLNDEAQLQLDQLLAGLDDATITQLETQLEATLAVAGNASALAAPALDAPPERLLAQLEADADQFFGSTPGSVTALDEHRAQYRAEHRAPRARVAAWGGWAVAAVLLLTLLIGRLAPTVPGSEAMPPLETNGALAEASVPNLDAARAALLEDDATLRLEWARSAWADFEAVQGDVVWNDALQEGYLRLVGMPANDPARSQYQLWIVDPERDAEPVDGGVFDVVTAQGEVIVPIRATLGVDQPVAFAITREQPGGVVVSEGPLLVVASRG